MAAPKFIQKATSSFLALLTGLALGACDDLPRDSEYTLSEVREGTFRVGIIENPPWTSYEQGKAVGIEVELVEQLAAGLGTRITWIQGGESDLMPALERFELHLVIGGLTDSNPWSKRVGLSRPYYTNRFVIGGRAGQHRKDIAHESIAVPEGLPALRAMVRERGAEVVTVPDLRATNVELVAAPAWQIAQLNREETGIELHRENHVMAVPPGENGWLMHLDRFLEREVDQVADLLRQEKYPQ